MNFQIQCPECGKRFTTHEDLTGKTVECGSCEHRFLIKPETMVPERAKTYPGEQREDDFLNRLAKPPQAASSAKKVRRYRTTSSSGQAPSPHVDTIMPASPAENIAAGGGVALLLFYALFFVAGTREGGLFQDVPMIKRIILASFVGLVGLSLMIYGAKKWRGKAVLFGLSLVAGLAALTATRPVLTTPEVAQDSFFKAKAPPRRDDPETQKETIKDRVGYAAVERQLRELESEFGSRADQHLIAIFIEDLSRPQFYDLQRYFKRAFAMPPDEAVNRYERNNNADSLLVISGFEIDFDQAVRVCDPQLGRATTYPELRLIDLKLSAIHTSEVDEDLRKKLSDPRNRSFFAMNLKELGNINQDRVKDAVRNLAVVPEDLELRYQDEIVVEFMRLLGSEKDPALLANLAAGFRRWAGGNPASLAVVTQKVGKWLEEGTKIPAGFIDYLIENKEPKGLAYVDELWSEEPESWNAQYLRGGKAAEPLVREHLEKSPMRLKIEAAKILASIGTEQSLPLLKELQETPDEELRILVERAIKAIEAK